MFSGFYSANGVPRVVELTNIIPDYYPGSQGPRYGHKEPYHVNKGGNQSDNEHMVNGIGKTNNMGSLNISLATLYNNILSHHRESK